jgi:hypothetical protein
LIFWMPQPLPLSPPGFCYSCGDTRRLSYKSVWGRARLQPCRPRARKKDAGFSPWGKLASNHCRSMRRLLARLGNSSVLTLPPSPSCIWHNLSDRLSSIF